MSLDYKRNYVPVLKAKKGELMALSEMDPQQKTNIIPLFEITPVPWDFENEEPLKGTSKHVKDTLDEIYKKWNTNKLYIDFQRNVFKDSVGALDYAHGLAEYLPDENFKPTVVVSLTSTPEYKEIIRSWDYFSSDNMALRIYYDTTTDFVNPTKKEVDEFLNELNITPDKVDLILDLGSIINEDPHLTYLVMRLILAEVPYLTDWKNVIMSSSSFPENLSFMKRKDIRTIKRSEWLAWKDLVTLNTAITRKPIYSDYAISHPVFTEIDPRIMDMTASIRYSNETDWVIVKGESLKKKEEGDMGYGQFPLLCKQLIDSGLVYPKEYSSGDKYIYECTAGEVGTGNATTWRKVGTNHYLNLVLKQLAILP